MLRPHDRPPIPIAANRSAAQPRGEGRMPRRLADIRVSACTGFGARFDACLDARLGARLRAAPAAYALLCIAALAPASEHGAPDTLDLPPTATRGVRVSTPAEGVHHLDGEALRRFATLEDALASLPGFRVRRAGGLGGYSELSFRGARATAVAVYVDGVRLNQDADAAPDLSRWPSLWFSSLTARTGFDAAGAAPGALARIDLSTHSARRAEVHARGGSFGTAEIAAQASYPLPFAPGWRLTTGAQRQSARNDYPVDSDNGTLYNTDDDATWNIGNNAYGSRGAPPLA